MECCEGDLLRKDAEADVRIQRCSNIPVDNDPEWKDWATKNGKPECFPFTR